MPEEIMVPQFELPIEMFTKPEDRPWKMLVGYGDSGEKEDTLGRALITCVNAHAWIPVTIANCPRGMIEDGLLVKTGPDTYMITKKAAGLLYSVYGK